MRGRHVIQAGEPTIFLVTGEVCVVRDDEDDSGISVPLTDRIFCQRTGNIVNFSQQHPASLRLERQVSRP
jgi:hypothetical protein